MHGTQFGHVVGVTPRGNIEEVRVLVERYSGLHVTVHSAVEVFRMIEAQEVKPSWLLNLWGELIVPASTLAFCGESLNIHPSFLPWARGSDPIVWTILNGWPAGATLHAMTSDVDGGPIWAQVRVPYDLSTTGGQLYDAVLQQCLDLFSGVWPRILEGGQHPQIQAVVGETRRRAELYDNQMIDLDDPKNASVLNFIRQLLAYDFGERLSLRLRLNGRSYRASLKIFGDKE